MNKEKKKYFINNMEQLIVYNSNIYFIDISGMTANLISKLRRCCYNYEVFIQVIKKNLFKKAFIEKKSKCFEYLSSLRGCTALMICNNHNIPAKIIIKFRQLYAIDKPLLITALIEDYYFIGDAQLSVLSKLKSKNEFISYLIILLKSKLMNIIISIEYYSKKILYELISYNSN